MPNLSSDVFSTHALDNILQVYIKTVQTILEQLHIYIWENCGPLASDSSELFVHIYFNTTSNFYKTAKVMEAVCQF